MRNPCHCSFSDSFISFHGSAGMLESTPSPGPPSWNGIVETVRKCPDHERFIQWFIKIAMCACCDSHPSERRKLLQTIDEGFLVPIQFNRCQTAACVYSDNIASICEEAVAHWLDVRAEYDLDGLNRNSFGISYFLRFPWQTLTNQ